MAASNPMRGRIRCLEFLGLFCASIGIWWNPLATDMKLAPNSDAHTHIPLILPLSVALIYLQARGVHLACERERWLGLILLTAALVLRGFTRWDVWPLWPGGRLSLSISVANFNTVVTVQPCQIADQVSAPACVTSRSVPTMINKIATNITPYSAMCAPSSSIQNLCDNPS